MSAGTPPPVGGLLGARPLPLVVLALIASAAVVIAAQLRVPGLVDGDSYFHVAYVKLLPGILVDRHFEWTRFSIWSDRFADKDLLFHLYLAPFVAVAGESGGKLAATLAAIAALSAIITFPLRHGLRGAALWALLAAVPGWHVVHRLLPVRSHVLALGLTVLFVEALVRDRRRSLGVLAFLTAWCHLSAPLLVLFAALHTLGRRAAGGAASWRAVGITALGVGAGYVLNPYFPNDVVIWWTNAVEVMRNVTGAGELSAEIFGIEFGEVGTRMLLQNHVNPLAWVLLALVFMPLRGIRMSERSGGLTLIAIAALGLGLVSARFLHELAVPLAFLAGASLTDDILRHRPLVSRAGVAALTCVIVVSAAAATAATREGFAALATYRSQRVYAPGIEAMRAEVRPGATVFHLGWADFNPLFYYAPDHRYIVALDPIFLYAHDRERFDAWMGILTGRDADPVRTIRETFGASAIFVRNARPIDTRFGEYLASRSDVRAVHADAFCRVFVLDP